MSFQRSAMAERDGARRLRSRWPWTTVYRCGAGNGVPPLVLQGGHREQRPTGTEDSHLAEPRPQRSDRPVRRSAGEALPTLGLRVLAGASGEAVDATSLHHLLKMSLARQTKLEEEEQERRRGEASSRRRKKRKKKKLHVAPGLQLEFQLSATENEKNRKRKKRKKEKMLSKV